MELATRVDQGQLGTAGRRLVTRLDPDAATRLAKDEDAQGELREAYLTQEASGMWLLRAHLTAVQGAYLHAPGPAGRAGSGRPDRSAGRPTHQGRISTRLILTADLDTILARTGQPRTGQHRTGQHCADQRGVGQRGALPGIVANGQPGGWELSPLQVQVLACDAETVPVLTDSSGRALDVGGPATRSHPASAWRSNTATSTAPTPTAKPSPPGVTPTT